MVDKRSQKASLKKLKKQVRVLQRKEEQSRNKLRAALMKARKLSRIYKIKLKGKMRVMKSKLAELQSSTYGKLAADLERQLLKGIEKKTRSLAQALSKIEKKHAAKLTKGISKKSKKKKKTKKDSGPSIKRATKKRR
jgi:hypothetical protein